MNISLSCRAAHGGRPSPSHPGLSFDFLARRFMAGAAAGPVQRSADAGAFLAFTSAAKFTRGETGRLVQSSANMPAYEWTANGAPMGLRIEGAATNICLHSQDWSAAAYPPHGLKAFGSGSVVNAAAAPDGTMSADLLTVDTSNATHGVLQFLNMSAPGIWTWSVFAKLPGTGVIQGLELSAYFWGQATYHAAFFDLAAGTVASVTAGSSARVDTYADGWRRCEFSIVTSIAQDCQFIANLSDTGSRNFFAGDGASGLLLWGAQVERNAASSYIPTGASAVVRAADTVQRNPAAGEMQTSQGSLAAGMTFAGVLGDGNGVCERGGINGQMLYQQSGLRFGTFDSSGQVTTPDAGMNRFEPFRAALSWGGGAGNRFIAGNRGGVVQQASGPHGGDFAGTLRLGTTQNGALPLNGWLRSLDVWPERLPDSVLTQWIS
jgi:hypothetical protein